MKSFKQSPMLLLMACLAGSPGYAQCKYEVDAVVITDVRCHGGNDGSIDVFIHSVNGFPITTKWLNIPNMPTNDTHPIDLEADTYYLKVTDSDGCVDTLEFTVNEPPPLAAVPNNVTVCAGTTVSLLQSVLGGVPGYLYQWTSTAGYACYACNNTDVVITQATQFNVTITDTNGCSINETVTVGANPTIQVSNVTFPEVCGLDGKILATPSGGSPPFEFSLNGGPFQTQPWFKDLQSGQYMVEVKDAAGCVKERTASVIDRTTHVGMQVFMTDVSCAGEQDGQAFISTDSGTVNWFSLDSVLFQTWPIFDNLAGGYYHLHVQDTNGCVESRQAFLYEPTAPAMHLEGIDLSCYGAGDGVVLASTSGGSYPVLSYILDGQSSPNGHFHNLAAGTHTMVCIDSTGCAYAQTVSLSEPAEILMDSLHMESASCNGEEDGEFEVYVSGGAGGFRYSLDGAIFQTSPVFADLPAGTYNLTIQDSSGCEVIQTVMVPEPPGIDISAWITDATCNSEKDGEIIVITSGGAVVSDFSIDNDNWQFSNTFTGLAASVYEVHVRDTLGCIYSTFVQVSEPSPIEIDGDITMNGGLADITTNATGGNGGYSYLWSTGDTTQNLTGLTNGIYVLYVTDTFGCIDSAFFVVAGTSVPDLKDNDKLFIYPNPTVDYLTARVMLSSSKKVQFELVDVLGQLVLSKPAQTLKETSIDFDVRHLAAGVYFLHVTIAGESYVAKVLKQ